LVISFFFSALFVCVFCYPPLPSRRLSSVVEVRNCFPHLPPRRFAISSPRVFLFPRAACSFTMHGPPFSPPPPPCPCCPTAFFLPFLPQRGGLWGAVARSTSWNFLAPASVGLLAQGGENSGRPLARLMGCRITRPPPLPCSVRFVYPITNLGWFWTLYETFRFHDPPFFMASFDSLDFIFFFLFCHRKSGSFGDCCCVLRLTALTRS